MSLICLQNIFAALWVHTALVICGLVELILSVFEYVFDLCMRNKYNISIILLFIL